MKYLIVGLGNPGLEYQHTRHNIGFDILDHFAEKFKTQFETGRYGEVAEAKFKGRKLMLLKPNTFMNLSGKAVRFWQQELQVSLEQILVITDDVALPLGLSRLKGAGSDGGHNGLKNINELLNTKNYPRLRIGVGNDYPRGKQVDFVLGAWSEEEWSYLQEQFPNYLSILQSFVFRGIQPTMNAYNKKAPPKK